MKVKVLRSGALSIATTKHKYNTNNVTLKMKIFVEEIAATVLWAFCKIN